MSERYVVIEKYAKTYRKSTMKGKQDILNTVWNKLMQISPATPSIMDWFREQGQHKEACPSQGLFTLGQYLSRLRGG